MIDIYTSWNSTLILTVVLTLTYLAVVKNPLKDIKIILQMFSLK